MATLEGVLSQYCNLCLGRKKTVWHHDMCIIL